MGEIFAILNGACPGSVGHNSSTGRKTIADRNCLPSLDGGRNLWFRPFFQACQAPAVLPACLLRAHSKSDRTLAPWVFPARSQGSPLSTGRLNRGLSNCVFTSSPENWLPLREALLVPMIIRSWRPPAYSKFLVHRTLHPFGQKGYRSKFLVAHTLRNHQAEPCSALLYNHRPWPAAQSVTGGTDRE